MKKENLLVNEFLNFEDSRKESPTFSVFFSWDFFLVPYDFILKRQRKKKVQKLFKGSMLGLYMGVCAEPYRLSPFMSSLFNKFRRSLIQQSLKQSSSDSVFFIFYTCGKSTFKTMVRTKTRHYLKKPTKRFLIRLAIGRFFVL